MRTPRLDAWLGLGLGLGLGFALGLGLGFGMEFGIKTMHFVPFEGGVIEYGVYLTP